MTPEPVGLLLSDDLLFTSRITGTAQALGFGFRAARSIDALVDLARDLSPRCVILDLAFPGLSLAGLLPQLRGVPRVIAYGSHVDTAGLRAAREAGCDPVLPRSKFVEDLATTLPTWMAE